MRCLLTADLHYALKQYDWLMDVAPHFDLVIIAGDHLDLSAHVDGQAQMVVVLKYLARLRTMTRLITCSGNHDLDARTPEGERTARWFAKIRALGIAADGDSVEFGDMLLTICPWWDGPVTCAAVGEQLARDAKRRRGTWGWIYHAPPAGSPTSWDGQRHYGDKELSAWIGVYRPDFVFSGHVHSSPFCAGGSWADRIGSTWIFNAGREIGPTPAHVVLDTEARSAHWLSTLRWEAARLDQATEAVSKVAELPAWLTAAGLPRDLSLA
jgi:Icc-related predicted phosphoesterase